MMGNKRSSGRERNQMILVAMLDVSRSSTKLCAYEDIVVTAWKLFPQEFGLRGYADKHPDSSDLHKPLYGPLKRDGLVRVQKKKFGLTERGLAVAENLRAPTEADSRPAARVRRDQLIEVDRLTKKSAVQLVQENQAADLLDTDLYDFYSVTVRTKPADFAGRVRTVDDAIDAAVAAQDSSINRDQLAWVVLARDALRKAQASTINDRAASRGQSGVKQRQEH
jgi:hypothetical protein